MAAWPSLGGSPFLDVSKLVFSDLTPFSSPLPLSALDLGWRGSLERALEPRMLGQGGVSGCQAQDWGWRRWVFSPQQHALPTARRMGEEGAVFRNPEGGSGQG